MASRPAQPLQPGADARVFQRPAVVRRGLFGRPNGGEGAPGTSTDAAWRSTILAGGQTGITVENAGGVAIENLVVLGAGPTQNTGFGIRCDNTLTRAHWLGHLRIAGLEARGFGVFGILVPGNHADFGHVLLTHCVMRDHLPGGVEVAGRLPWDPAAYAHADVHVTHCQAFDSPGDPAYGKNHSGSGMVLYQADRGWVAGCACARCG